MASEIVWYGERGIVNALVVHLSSGAMDKQAAGVRQFLSGVMWAGKGTPNWVGRITDVSFLVEVGMAQFGNPDLILVCRAAEVPQPWVVFVEAKVVPYLGSAMSNAGTVDARGFNSSINGQLALRYRLAHALANWSGCDDLETGCLTRLLEPDEIHTAYRQLGDKAASPRHLDKQNVLRILQRQGMKQLPHDRFHFVAWTWDAEPFFDYHSDKRPAFLNPDQSDGWDQVKSRVGWIGFRQIEGELQPGRVYQDAFRTMLSSPAPSVHVSEQPLGDDTVGEAITRSSTGIVSRVRDIALLAREQLGASVSSVSGNAFSLSIGGLVRARVVPQLVDGKEEVHLGIRTTLSPESWDLPQVSVVGIVESGRGAGRGGFYFIRLPDDRAKAVKLASAIYQTLSERIGLESGELEAADH